MKAKQTRQNWSDGEKKRICEFVNQWEEKHGRRPEWREIKRWWESDHPQKTISQSTISKIIKKSPVYVSSRNLSRQRHRPAQFPRLHDALYLWMKAVEKHTTITGPILCAKAKNLFPQLYPGEQMPKFSNGWLDGWKRQHGVKEYHQHGEAGSAPITESEEQMQEIRRMLSGYEPRNIFNADKTGYCFRMQPERGLATEQMAGKKKDKAHDWQSSYIMSIPDFLNPVEEETKDSPQDIAAHIVATDQEAPLVESASEEEDEEPPEPKVTLREAAEALGRVLIWDEQQDPKDRDPKVTRALKSLQGDLRRRRLRGANSMQQTRSEDFFGSM